jgi:glyoxylate carboligase
MDRATTERVPKASARKVNAVKVVETVVEAEAAVAVNGLSVVNVPTVNSRVNVSTLKANPWHQMPPPWTCPARDQTVAIVKRVQSVHRATIATRIAATVVSVEIALPAPSAQPVRKATAAPSSSMQTGVSRLKLP